MLRATACLVSALTMGCTLVDLCYLNPGTCADGGSSSVVRQAATNCVVNGTTLSVKLPTGTTAGSYLIADAEVYNDDVSTWTNTTTDLSDTLAGDLDMHTQTGAIFHVGAWHSGVAVAAGTVTVNFGISSTSSFNACAAVWEVDAHGAPAYTVHSGYADTNSATWSESITPTTTQYTLLVSALFVDWGLTDVAFTPPTQYDAQFISGSQPDSFIGHQDVPSPSGMYTTAGTSDGTDNVVGFTLAYTIP